MNVVLPEKDKVSKKRIAIYVILISICVLALIVAVCVQILGNDFTNSIFGVSTLKSKTEEEEQELRVNFDNLFLNNLHHILQNLQEVLLHLHLMLLCCQVHQGL